MQIKQFEDKHLAQYSYAILSESEKKVILVDPSRDPEPYLSFAKENKAQITGVIETHPHADFVSSHLEIHQHTGATIYTSKDVNAYYPHQAFDGGQSITVGDIKLSAINTPGHSPDSISILLEHDGKQKAVFTGDTLFIGDCGRPDLREGAGNVQAKREDLARQMYYSLREKLMVLDDTVLVYPAHGAGTLCGKNLSKESSSTIGQEKISNWSLQESTEKEFIANLLSDQPFVPAYFPFDVELNRRGAAPLADSISQVKVNEDAGDGSSLQLNKSMLVVDTRDEKKFKKGHLPNAVNIMVNGRFETWLGSIIKPGERFYLAAENREQLDEAILRSASIGYETAIEEALVLTGGMEPEPELDIDLFRHNQEAFHIIDVRNPSEVKEKKIFENSTAIPLSELRNRLDEIPADKPIVVHCAGGYRSAAASSLIHLKLNGQVNVYDLSGAVKQFQ